MVVVFQSTPPSLFERSEKLGIPQTRSTISRAGVRGLDRLRATRSRRDEDPIEQTIERLSIEQRRGCWSWSVGKRTTRGRAPRGSD
jgi:hypothetical protein